MEEVLHLGATDAEIAETLDVGAIMGGTVSMKSVRHAFAVMDPLKKGALHQNLYGPLSGCGC